MGLKKSAPLYQHTIMTVDLYDYSGIDDPDLVSEDGLQAIVLTGNEMGRDGWQFIEAARDLSTPTLVHLHFRRPATD